MTYFEDYEVGSTRAYGPILMTQPEIIEFASRFDAQPIHTDPDFAQTGPYGGLIASGWHTASASWGLIATQYFDPVSSLGGPGVDELRWVRPVRPGDQLMVHLTVVEARVSASKPDRGVIRSAIEVRAQDGRTVMTFTGINFVLRRPETPTQ